MEPNTLLEKWFVNHAAKYDKFPQSSADYVSRYFTLKNWLKNNCYGFIGASTATDGGYYTDHGIEHFEQVIRYAGNLLHVVDVNSDIPLNCYEVYLLMVAILLHDAGNIYGRAGHEKNAFTILREIGDAVTTCNIEKRHISNIAEVHGGRNKDGGKDTINAKFSTDQSDYLNATFRPKFISALVRLADEICEDKTRTSTLAIKSGTIPRSSEIFHYYASCISSSMVDYQGRQIRLTYDIESKLTQTKFGKLDSEVYLIDEIFERIEKMHNERIYCSRFFLGLVQIDSIRVTINITDQNYEISDTLTIDTQTGYPTESLSLATRHESWSGEALKERIMKE
ncbi:hypothetical protein [Atlantibacter hermannii]|uniref:HD domain-containing protein n=1 Tax=Atlantibacter hermannii TaxID=565 RepID=UPI002FDB3127